MLVNYIKMLLLIHFMVKFIEFIVIELNIYYNTFTDISVFLYHPVIKGGNGMKWYNCYSSTRWGIEISKEGEVTQINYVRGDDKRIYQKETISGEILMDAFEAIIRSSDEGSHYLAHNIKGSDADILSLVAQFEIARSNAIIKAIKSNH